MIYALIMHTEDSELSCLKFKTLAEAASYIEFAKVEIYSLANFFDKFQEEYKEEDFFLIEEDMECPACSNGTAHKEGDEMSIGKSFQLLNMADPIKIISLTDYKKKWTMN